MVKMPAWVVGPGGWEAKEAVWLLPGHGTHAGIIPARGKARVNESLSP